MNEKFQKVQLAQDCKTSSASNVSKCLGRSFHSSSVCCHGDDGDEKGPDVVDITFIDKTGCETQVLTYIQGVFQYPPSTPSQIFVTSNTKSLCVIKDENSAMTFVYKFFKQAGPKITTCCGSLRFMGL